jgi:putative ABC transport system ATP-binding protein
LHGLERLREVHPHESPRLPRSPDARALFPRRSRCLKARSRSTGRYSQSQIGFIFQNFNLLPRTSALENVELPLLYGEHRLTNAQLREKAGKVLDAVGLAGREDHHPSQLSGGQQQRVAIARALINDPEIVLADEPTGNLDSRTSLEIMDIFQKLNDRGITIVMVTHETDIAAFAKRNLTMRDGAVQSDQPVVRRLSAASEAEKLPETP